MNDNAIPPQRGRFSSLADHALLTRWRRPAPQRLNLALQGGGSHGAFTWGVLDALLARWIDWDNIVSVSHAFKVNIPGLDKPLIGEYDLLIKEGDGRTIVDWKTSASRWSEGKADRDFQATAFSYAYLMESDHDTIPAFRFDVVTKTKNPSCENHYTQRTKDDLQRFVRIATAIEQAVKQGVFLPAETSFGCSDCQFAEACKAWHRSSAAKHVCMAA